MGWLVRHKPFDGHFQVAQKLGTKEGRLGFLPRQEPARQRPVALQIRHRNSEREQKFPNDAETSGSPGLANFLLVHQRRDRNLAKLHWTVVTLESDAARLAFIGVVRHCR